MIDHILYPFSPNIPWEVNDKIVIPKLPSNLINKIKKYKTFNVVCPGYLLESFVVASIKDIFIRSNIKISKWIMPKCYSSALSVCNLSYSGSNGNMFDEYNRIKTVVEAYPSPIFMDADNNVYFNLLFNYGKRVNYRNSEAPFNNEPFWKQILKNTLLFDSSYDYKRSFDLSSYKSNLNIKDYIVIDNSNLFGVVANGKIIKNRLLFPNQARDLAKMFESKKIKCVIMTNNKKDYFGNNLFAIDSWDKLDSLQVLLILFNARGVMSPDPNIYLLSALLGCSNLLCCDSVVDGWRFKDLDGFCDIKDNWIENDNPINEDILRVLG